LAYAVIGGFTTVFSLISLFVKEKLYIGEATVATIFGVIVGPHCLNWFSPTTWGNTDNITLELSRIVLVVQIFAVAVELPKKYMLKHWLSVFLLLLPVMTFGWLISSVFIWKLVPTLSWVEALVIAACVTATDPVLASAVVGKGKFARRVPGHLRNLLSAESGSNDGMAFPFAYLALNCIHYSGQSGKIAFHFIVITVLYECVFGTILGAIIGYSGRHLIKFAERKNLIDRESFLVFYFVLALFCTGVGSIIGVDDLLVAFAAGAAFSWDGWFARKTEESHVSNVIDLLLNMAFFVYFGAIIPWELYNEPQLGILPWKLVIIAILLILFRRIPIMLALKPFIPDIRTWREALFCGHFGPIGVGAIFISILARAELEHEEPTPLAELPPPGSPNYMVVACIWPVVTFMIIASIIVHGSSIAVFTLGKRLNNLTITMTYTTNGNHSQGWLSRLPGTNSTRTSFSFHKQDISNTNVLTTTEDNENIGAVYPVTSKVAKPAGGMTRRRKNKRKQRLLTDEPHIPQNIPIDLNAERRAEREKFEEDERAAAAAVAALQAGEPLPVVIKNENGENIQAVLPTLKLKEVNRDNITGIQAYQEGSKMIIEDSDGEVIDTVDTDVQSEDPNTLTRLPSLTKKSPDNFDSRPPQEHKKGPRNILEPVSGGRRVVAYRLDDDVIIENLEGEVIRRYRIANKPVAAADESTFVPEPLVRSQSFLTASLNRTLSFVGLKKSNSTRASSSKGGTSFVPVLTSSKPSEDIDDDRLQKQLHKLFDNGKSSGGSSAKANSSFAGASAPSAAVSSGAEKTTTTPVTTAAQTVAAAKPPSTALNLRPASPAPRKSFILSSSNDEYSNSESESESDVDDEDEETEIEKQRRLAALKHQEEEDNREYLASRARALAEAEKAIEKSASKH
jgi:CPA1 family monovalent cation:H+ antiporter